MHWLGSSLLVTWGTRDACASLDHAISAMCHAQRLQSGDAIRILRSGVGC